MNESTGGIRGWDRDELDSVAFRFSSTENSVIFSSEDHPTPSSGLQSTLLWMGNRFVGVESSGWLDGIHTSFYGESGAPG